MRFTDLMMAFPALLLAIVLAAIFQPSLWIVALVIAMVNWVQIARVIYTETRSLAEREFIDGRAVDRRRRAAASSSATSCRIWCRPSWSRARSASRPRCCSRRRSRYLGVGVQPPTPSWGNIIFENQTYFTTAPWLVFIPGAAIILLALGFNLVGDALRDILDPTQKGRY